MSVSKSEKAVLTAGMLLAAVAGCSPSWAAGPVIVATVDHARLVKIPVGTETLIIGNPTIADITMLKQNNLMILTPKSFGETNFIALDKDGAPLAESVIQVVNGGRCARRAARHGPPVLQLRSSVPADRASRRR